MRSSSTQHTNKCLVSAEPQAASSLLGLLLLLDLVVVVVFSRSKHYYTLTFLFFAFLRKAIEKLENVNIDCS